MKSILISFTLLISLQTHAQQERWDLPSCIAYAFEHNLDIRESEFTEQIQGKELDFQKNTRLPTLSANMDNGLSYGFQQVFSGEFIGQYKAIRSYRNSGSVRASVVLWQKNVQKIRISNEAIKLKNTLLTTEQKRFELQLEIIAKYYSVLIAKERLGLARQVFENRERQKENKEKLYELGNIAQNALSEEKSNWIQDKQNLQREKINLSKALFELAILLQLPNKDNFDIEDVVLENMDETRSLDEVIVLALSNRASVRVATKKVALAQNEIRSYRSQYYPKVSLDYSLGSSAQQVFQSENISFREQYRNNFYQYASVGIQIPIFNQGNTKVKIQQAKINEDLQALRLAQEKQALTNTIEQLYFDILTAKENYQAAIETEEQTKEVYHFSEKSYAIGNITSFEYTGKRNEYVLAQLKKIQSKYELLFKQRLLESYSLAIHH